MNIPVAGLQTDNNNNSSTLNDSQIQGKRIVELEGEEEFFDASEEQDWLPSINIPLSIFHYEDYNIDSDWFTSLYNISSGIFKEINRACPERQALNLALSILMLPYIVFTALGLVIYNRLKINHKTKINSEENKVNESKIKRLGYGVLASVVIFVNIAILIVLAIPATLALATFYLLNKKLSHSLIAALKINNGLYKNEHQNIEISFCEKEAIEPNIEWDIKIKFPPQFEQLFKDLYKNNKWVEITHDSEKNTVLTLSVNVHLENGLQPLRGEIKNMFATSIQEFAKTVEGLMKLEKKDITYDKLKELLNTFRLKVIDSVDPKLVSYLVEDMYQVAFIQAIKISRERRKEDFSLQEKLESALVKQELEGLGKELPTEREIIIKDLKTLGKEVPDNLNDGVLPLFKSEWKRYEISKKTVIDVYNDQYPQETKQALSNAEAMIKKLKEIGKKRYEEIKDKLREIHQEKDNLTNSALKRKLADLFKLNNTDQYIYQELIKSRIEKVQAILDNSSIPNKQDLLNESYGLEENVHICSYNDINSLLDTIYLEITKCKIQKLFEKQKKDIKDSCKLLCESIPILVEMITFSRAQIERYLAQPTLLKQIIKNQNEYLKAEQNDRGEDQSSIKLIEMHLKNNGAILELLTQLELEQKELLASEEKENHYKNELTSKEKIKFAIIEDELLKVLRQRPFNEGEIRQLFEKTELEYCLAEKCIKNPVIAIKDNIKYFCQDLLSPLIDRLVSLIINNIPKDNENRLSRALNSFWTSFGYIQMGVSAAMNKNESTEGKALNVAHNAYMEGETLLEHLETSYEKVGAFLGDLFSDEGKTFKNDLWPEIIGNFHAVWCRFSKDIEIKLVSKGKTIDSKLDELNTKQHNHSVNPGNSDFIAAPA